MLDKKKKYPKPLGDSLKGLVQQLGIEPKLKEYQILDAWPEIVGENVANISKAEKVVEKILYVKVKSMTWRTELLFQKPQILKNIKDKVGTEIIYDIRFI